MQQLQKRVPFNFGISTTIFNKNLTTPKTSWPGRRRKSWTSSSTWSASPIRCSATATSRTRASRSGRRRDDAQFFLDRVRMDPLLDGQNYIYMHYADMIANGYHRLAPCPFQTQGIMLNPNGDLFFCENSDVVGNSVEDDAEAIYFRQSSQEHRDLIRDEKCPGCLSPCQMNVSAVKQVVPYVRFLVRAGGEKLRSHEPKAVEQGAA
jgi:hypothetical protein